MSVTWQALRDLLSRRSFAFPSNLEPFASDPNEIVPAAILDSCMQSVAEVALQLSRTAEEDRIRSQKFQQLSDMLDAVPAPPHPTSTPLIPALTSHSPSTPVHPWTTSSPSVSAGESSDKRKQFVDPDGRVHLLHSTTSAVSDSEVSLFLRRCTDPSRLPFFTTGEGIKLDSAKAARTITLQASRLHLESGTADSTVGSTTKPPWFHASTSSTSPSPSSPPIFSSVWSSTSMYSTVRYLPIFYDIHFDLLLRGQWGEGRDMLNLSYFSLHFDADSWISLHETLRNVESVFVVVFGSAWELCLHDLSQAMLSHLAWRVYPARFLRWIVELALTNFFLLASQCYSPCDVQSRYPEAPSSLLLQSDVVSLLRALVKSINPTYPNHQYFTTEIFPRFHELFPSWKSIKQPAVVSAKAGGGAAAKDPHKEAPSKGKRDRRSGPMSPGSSDPTKQARTEAPLTPIPKVTVPRQEPCLRHVAALFNVEGAPACDLVPCRFIHHSSKKAVPVDRTLELLALRPPRTFTPAVLSQLTTRLSKRSHASPVGSPVSKSTTSDKE
jgi:hypothetical protein